MGKKVRIGLLGCGNIGRILAEAIDKGEVNCELVIIFDQDIRRVRALAESLDCEPKIAKKFDGLLQDTDLVVEAASQEAVRDYGMRVVGSGKNLMIMSVGALVDDEFRDKLMQEVNRNTCRIYVPSGAIAGLDGIKAARVEKIELVELTTRKRPAELGVKADRETVLYEGPAREGIKRFPKNVNVAATLSLVGVGFDKTILKIVADPRLDKNIHEVYVRGGFGEFRFRMENLPSPNNPKTSYLAALSAIAMLKEINNNFKMGV